MRAVLFVSDKDNFNLQKFVSSCFQISISYSFNFRYSVLSDIPRSCAASFRLPWFFSKAFTIISFSFSSSERDSSTTASVSSIWLFFSTVIVFCGACPRNSDCGVSYKFRRTIEVEGSGSGFIVCSFAWCRTRGVSNRSCPFSCQKVFCTGFPVPWQNYDRFPG